MRSTAPLFPAAAAVAACLALVPAPPTTASPFDPTVVAADAAWVAHLDVEAAVASKIGGPLLKNPGLFGADFDDLNAVKEQFGFDPFEAVFGVTAYGVGEIGEDVVIVVTGSDAIAHALATAANEDDSGIAKTDNGYSIEGDVEIVVIKRHDDTLYVVGGEDVIKDALRVTKGENSNLTDVKQGILRAPSAAGVIAFVAFAGGLDAFLDEEDLNDLGPVAGFIEGAKGFTASIGEHDGTVRIDVVFVAKDEKIANGLFQTLNGMVAMARGMLVAGMFEAKQDNDELDQWRLLADLLDKVDLNADGRDVSLGVSYDVSDVLKLITEDHD